MQVQINTQTRTVLAVGTFPTPPDDPAIAVVTLTDAEAAKLNQRGVKTVDEDGAVTVFLDPAIVQAEQEAEAAAQAATTERTAATADLRDQYAAAMSALDAIIASATALPDCKAIARATKRMLRLLKAQVG